MAEKNEPQDTSRWTGLSPAWHLDPIDFDHMQEARGAKLRGDESNALSLDEFNTASDIGNPYGMTPRPPDAEAAPAAPLSKPPQLLLSFRENSQPMIPFNRPKPRKPLHRVTRPGSAHKPGGK